MGAKNSIRKGSTKATLHFNCTSSKEKQRVLLHSKKCVCRNIQQNSKTDPSFKTHKLQTTVADTEKCIYMVRGAASGPGKLVYVLFKSDNNECSSESCIQARELAYNSTG